MKSMTAYGYSEFQNEYYLMTMEVKSYNNRYLEVSYFAPPYLSSYENTVNSIIKEHAKRGHIDFSIKVKNLKGNIEVSLDENAVKAYLCSIEKVQDLASEKNIIFNLNMIDILDREGVLSSVRSEGIELYQEGLDSCMKAVLEQFDKAKEREGLVTLKDLTHSIDCIASSLEVVKNNVSKLEELIKENLKSRINEMFLDQNYDENRILTEVAVMLNRFTINEEVVRLSAHIDEFRKLLKSNEPVGKRIDFLSQEMNREINTIGSKSQMIEINFEVVNMKDYLENIREQVRNIE